MVFTQLCHYIERVNERGEKWGEGDFLESKIPLKIKIFLWYLKKGVMLTKDNLIKRK